MSPILVFLFQTTDLKLWNCIPFHLLLSLKSFWKLGVVHISIEKKWTSISFDCLAQSKAWNSFTAGSDFLPWNCSYFWVRNTSVNSFLSLFSFPDNWFEAMKFHFFPFVIILKVLLIFGGYGRMHQFLIFYQIRIVDLFWGFGLKLGVELLRSGKGLFSVIL